MKISLASGFEFESEPGVSILEAAERHGARLEYSCRKGRCSSCKARVATGSTTPLHPETGLGQHESGAGWILTCVRTVASDVVLDEDTELVLDLPRPSTQPLRIDTIERVSSDIAIVRFRLPPGARWTYLPGQYVEIIGPGGIRRAYSMANAPSPDARVELHIKRFGEGELSSYWFGSASPNDLLRLYGPLGTFVLRDSARPLVFLATGTGIAPIKALLEQLLSADPTRSVRLYWGGRTLDDLHWRPEEWPDHWAFVPVLSRPGADWTGRTGHVQHALLADGGDLGEVDLYACGSDEMIRDARRLATGAGLTPGRFFAEAFVDTAPTEDDV